MNYFKCVLGFFSLALIPCSLLAQPTNNKNLREIIQAEFEKFRPVAVVLNIKLGNVIFSDDMQSHVVNNDSNVVINLNQIEKYTRDSSDNFKSIFIKYVIAHELGHKIQFNGYRRDVINVSKGEQIVFLECDADVLAGFIITQVFNTVETPALVDQNPNFDAIQYANAMASETFSVYNRIIEMDKLNVSIKTHPTNEQRLIAVRQGILLGNCTFYYFLSSTGDLSNSKLPVQDFQNLKNLYMDIGKAIGFDPYNVPSNPFMWAHEEAIRIIHENNALARNLIRYNETITWHTSAAHPTVDFSFRIVNHNPRDVRFSGRIFTEIISRKEPKNIIKIGPADAYLFDQTLSANQDTLFSGTLNWYADNTYMPHIILPGDERSLYWVFDKIDPMPDLTDVQTYNVDFITWNNNSLENIIDLINFVVAKKDRLLNCANGIGVSYATRLGQISGSKIFYQPNFKTGNEDGQQIYSIQKDSTITYVFNASTSSDSIITIQHFNEIMNKITSSLRQFQPQALQVTEDGRYEQFIDKGENIITINMEYSDILEKFLISIEVTNRTKAL